MRGRSTGERGLVRWGRGHGGDPRSSGVCLDPPAGGGGKKGTRTNPVGKGYEREGTVGECCTHW